jgi:hypothetical protein
VIECVEELIAVLEKQIQPHWDSAEGLVQEHEKLKLAFVLIICIKGIAKTSAVQILLS